MAKIEVYDGMPVIEASDQDGLEKKLSAMPERPEKYVVRISKRATKIKKWAFSTVHSNEIAAVLIPDSIIDIEEEAFLGCSCLTSIVIPDSVKFVGSGAFAECNGLTNVIIGKSVQYICGTAFRDCTGLTNIVIPDSVIIIEDGAFRDCI